MRALLALDTCDRTLGVAVAVDGEVRCSHREATAHRHSVRIVPAIEACLAGAGVGREDLGCLAVTRGPGSFTGLRVAMATVKGLAAALEVPVAGVSSLVAMARGFRPVPALVVPVLDARKSQVYGAAWDGPTGAVVAPEAAWEPGGLAEAVAAAGGRALFLGSGVAPYRDVWRSALGDRYVEAPPSRWAVPPEEVALLGVEAWQRGEAVPAARVAPVYCRRSEAEENRARRSEG